MCRISATVVIASVVSSLATFFFGAASGFGVVVLVDPRGSAVRDVGLWGMRDSLEDGVAMALPTTMTSRRIYGRLSVSSLYAASSSSSSSSGGGGGDGKKKKKRRRRKLPITADDAANSDQGVGKGSSSPSSPSPPPALDADVLAARTGFDLASDAPIGLEVKDDDSKPLDLPSIRETLDRKKEKEEQEAEEKEKEEWKPKINRRDIEAMKKLIEVQPFADADDSYFEEEEYGTVSALLAEKARPFLGIAAGPLQVGHFIGALGIILMAYIEYPGFPLTNLPTPLRECLQGGLGTVYAINAVLAVLATFKAEERGQSKILWAVKTFSVGGLAFDQLTQLPTLEEIEKRKSIKGKRALGKNRR